MKALVYDGPGKREWRDVAEPTLTEPTDAIVRVDTSSTPMLLRMLAAGRIDPARFVTRSRARRPAAGRGTA